MRLHCTCIYVVNVLACTSLCELRTPLFRVFVVILVGISILWIPLIKAAQQGQLFLYIQALTGYVSPPICSLFLLAVFVPRVNEQVRVFVQPEKGAIERSCML